MEKRIIGKSIVAKFAESANTQIVNFIVGLVLARLLSAEDYGVYSILLIFVNIGQALVQGGLGNAIIQKKTVDDADYSTAFVTSLTIAVFAYFALFFFAPTIARVYKLPAIIAPLRVIAMAMFPGALLTVVNARLTKRMEFDILAQCSLICVLATGVVGVALAVAGAGVWALVTQQILSFLLLPAVYCIRKRWFPGWRFRQSNCKRLFGFGARILLTDVVNAIYLNIQGFIIGIKYSADALAYFSRGQVFPRMLLTTTDSTVSAVLFPIYSDLQDERDSMKSMMLNSLSKTTFVVYPMLMGLFSVADLMIDVVLTEKWAACVIFVKIYCIAYLFWPLDSAAQQVIKACGAGKSFLYMSILKKIISSVILLISVCFARTVDVFALSAIVIYVSDVTIGMLTASRLIHLSVSDIVRSIGRNLICSCGILVICTLPRLFCSSFLELTMRISLGVAVYIVFSSIINRSTLREAVDTVIGRSDKTEK